MPAAFLPCLLYYYVCVLYLLAVAEPNRFKANVTAYFVTHVTLYFCPSVGKYVYGTMVGRSRRKEEERPSAATANRIIIIHFPRANSGMNIQIIE